MIRFCCPYCFATFEHLDGVTACFDDHREDERRHTIQRARLRTLPRTADMRRVETIAIRYGLLARIKS